MALWRNKELQVGQRPPAKELKQQELARPVNLDGWLLVLEEPLPPKWTQPHTLLPLPSGRNIKQVFTNKAYVRESLREKGYSLKLRFPKELKTEQVVRHPTSHSATPYKSPHVAELHRPPLRSLRHLPKPLQHGRALREQPFHHLRAVLREQLLPVLPVSVQHPHSPTRIDQLLMRVDDKENWVSVVAELLQQRLSSHLGSARLLLYKTCTEAVSVEWSVEPPWHVRQPRPAQPELHSAHNAR